jgi:hypothetical protein
MPNHVEGARSRGDADRPHNIDALWRSAPVSPCTNSKFCDVRCTSGAERQTVHIAELRKRAAEADAKLKRLYDAIENGVTDLSELMLKDRIAEAIRDQARADTERAKGAINRQGPTSPPNRSRRLPGPPASECGSSAAVTGAITSARSPRASKSTRWNFASWARNANCCVPSSPLQVQKRRVLACPVLYRI